MSMDLNELADRVETLAGPDREVDALIAAAVGEPHGEKSGWANNHNGDYYVIDECARAYTISLDAAMSLAVGQFPNNTLYWAMGRVADKFALHIRCWPTDQRYAEWLARFVTAAALRTKALGAVHTLTEGS